MIHGINPHKAGSIVPENNSGSLRAQQQGEKAGAEAAVKTEGGGAVSTTKVAELESRLQALGNDLSVAVDEGTGVMFVKITDNKTGELVKQIPAQEFIDAELKMERIVGLIIDDQA
jgi:flagellar protein FlaG